MANRLRNDVGAEWIKDASRPIRLATAATRDRRQYKLARVAKNSPLDPEYDDSIESEYFFTKFPKRSNIET